MENKPTNNNLPEYDFSFILNKTVEFSKKYFKEILLLGAISSIFSFLGNILIYMITINFIETANIKTLVYAEILKYIRLNLGEILGFTLILSLGIIILQLINLLISSTLIYYLNNKLSDKTLTLDEAFLKTTNKIWIILFTNIIFLMFLTGLSLLLIIPAVIFGVYWFLFLYAIIIRDKEYVNALIYSKKLIQGNWWRTLGYTILIGFIIGGINLVLNLISFPITLVSSFIENYYLQQLTLLPTTFLSISVGYFLIIYGLIYFKVLEKEKGIKNELE